MALTPDVGTLPPARTRARTGGRSNPTLRYALNRSLAALGTLVFVLFFNFFLFSLIGFNAASNVVVALWDDLLGLLGLRNAVALQVRTWPAWCQLGLLFVVKDFIQWNTHRLLHRVPWLWEFHKVHHSVQQMGFAAHLRYHWFENVAYKAIQYVPLSLIGFVLRGHHRAPAHSGHLLHRRHQDRGGDRPRGRTDVQEAELGTGREEPGTRIR